jgi:hypothetical protein
MEMRSRSSKCTTHGQTEICPEFLQLVQQILGEVVSRVTNLRPPSLRQSRSTRSVALERGTSEAIAHKE